MAKVEFDEHLRRGADTEPQRIHLRALPLLDAAGTITEWVAVADEVTEPQR